MKQTALKKKSVQVEVKLYDALVLEAAHLGLTPDQLNEKLLRDYLAIYK